MGFHSNLNSKKVIWFKQKVDDMLSLLVRFEIRQGVFGFKLQIAMLKFDLIGKS